MLPSLVEKVRSEDDSHRMSWISSFAGVACPAPRSINKAGIGPRLIAEILQQRITRFDARHVCPLSIRLPKEVAFQTRIHGQRVRCRNKIRIYRRDHPVMRLSRLGSVGEAVAFQVCQGALFQICGSDRRVSWLHSGGSHSAHSTEVLSSSQPISIAQHQLLTASTTYVNDSVNCIIPSNLLDQNVERRPSAGKRAS